MYEFFKLRNHNPQFKNKIKNSLMGGVTKALPSVVGEQMPKSTGPGIPFK